MQSARLGLKPSILEIQRVVCAIKRLKLEELKSRNRSHRLSHSRQMGFLLCREFTDASFPMIARHFGGLDHSSLIFGVRQAKQREEESETVRAEMAAMRNMIRSILAAREEAKRESELSAWVNLGGELEAVA